MILKIFYPTLWTAIGMSTCAPAVAMELPDGTIVTGKTTSLLGAS